MNSPRPSTLSKLPTPINQAIGKFCTQLDENETQKFSDDEEEAQEQIEYVLKLLFLTKQIPKQIRDDIVTVILMASSPDRSAIERMRQVEQMLTVICASSKQGKRWCETHICRVVN